MKKNKTACIAIYKLENELKALNHLNVNVLSIITLCDNNLLDALQNKTIDKDSIVYYFKIDEEILDYVLNITDDKNTALDLFYLTEDTIKMFEKDENKINILVDLINESTFIEYDILRQLQNESIRLSGQENLPELLKSHLVTEKNNIMNNFFPNHLNIIKTINEQRKK